jgi:hypothetical protein
VLGVVQILDNGELTQASVAANRIAGLLIVDNRRLASVSVKAFEIAGDVEVSPGPWQCAHLR